MSKDGILTVKQTKTGGSILQAPVNKYALRLIKSPPDYYRDDTGYRHHVLLKEIAQIAGINELLSTHCAYHTFVMIVLND